MNASIDETLFKSETFSQAVLLLTTMDFSQAAGLIYAELTTWTHTAIRYVPKLAAAVLLVIFTFLSRWLSRWVVRGLAVLD